MVTSAIHMTTSKTSPWFCSSTLIVSLKSNGWNKRLKLEWKLHLISKELSYFKLVVMHENYVIYLGYSSTDYLPYAALWDLKAFLDTWIPKKESYMKALINSLFNYENSLCYLKKSLFLSYLMSNITTIVTCNHNLLSSSGISVGRYWNFKSRMSIWTFWAIRTITS